MLMDAEADKTKEKKRNETEREQENMGSAYIDGREDGDG